MSLFSPLYTASKTGATKTNPSAPGPLISRQNKVAVTDPSVSKSFSELEAANNALQTGTNTGKPNPNNEKPVSNKNKFPDSTFKFNLAPHRWSLPTQPRTVEGRGSSIKDGRRTISSLSLDPELNSDRDGNFHGMRRGRMWFYDTNSVVQTTDVDESGNLVVESAPKVSLDGGAQRAATRLAREYRKFTIKDRKFGFQFLWNPESISQSVDVNMQVTPSLKDRYRTVSGVFPSMEYVNLNIMLDRTNDFACIRSERTGSGVPANGWKNLLDFYKEGFFPLQDSRESVMIEKIEDLANKGTLHDLEYLFKTVNGSGIGEDGDWANLLGRKTADIGFLQPTLLGIQLGPSLQNSLSYVGWINTLNINHVAFNQSMVPIRTQVSMGIRCFTGTQVAGY